MSKIQRRRKKAGMTQVELAERLSVSEITVQKWESGERIPRVPKLKKLAKLFGCGVEDLI